MSRYSVKNGIMKNKACDSFALPSC